MKIRLIAAMCLSLACATQSYADDSAMTASAPAATADSAQGGSLQAGQAFLQANKSKPGVVTLPDGLQYKVITAGTGPSPTDQDIVTVEYTGKLINGTEFDSSIKHGGTIDFQVGQVIPGWVEALKLMQPGATWELYIPSNLAYGDAGAPPAIGPNETLVFTVKLVSFKKAA
jgi:FKBP-type peptidyl-prolyl cis-trans isomerase FklB